jgi:fatty acid desaturase
MYIACSPVFIHLGLAGAHHHPAIWHAGDNTEEQASKSIDWGIFQLFAVSNRPDVDKSIVLSSITFGRHSLHHLFPTIDLCYLPYLLPELETTCKEFGVLDLFPHSKEKASPWSKRRTLTLWEGWTGMFQQVRTIFVLVILVIIFFVRLCGLREILLTFQV